MTTLRVGTMNCRNRADRWRQRRQLLVDQLAEPDLDVVGLQELRRWPSQARWITGRLNDVDPNGPRWSFHPTWKTGLWGLWEGVAVLSRLPVVETGWLDLGGQHRVAGHARVVAGDGGVLDFYNTHLATGDAALRRRQAERLLAWMDRWPGTPKVLVGDLNARPGSSTVRLLGERLRSAYAVAHGDEPPRTAPTPLRAPEATSGVVIDYVFVDHHVDVVAAELVCHRPDPHDPRLLPSDHYGLAATISLGGG